jgi:Flp pilus assembly protein TadD
MMNEQKQHPQALSKHPGNRRWIICLSFWCMLFCAFSPSFSNAAETQTPAPRIRILSTQGKVEISKAGTQLWIPAKVNMPLATDDIVRTGRRSKAALQMTDKTVLKIRQLTTMVIQPPQKKGEQPLLNLRSGSVFFFSRESPKEVPFRTSLTSGAIRGTEFELSAIENGATTLTMVDGLVDLTTPMGNTTALGGEQVVIEPNQSPRKTPMLNPESVIQWTLYYPGILDTSELQWANDGPPENWKSTLTAYKRGNLPQAMALLPEAPNQDEEEGARLLRATIWLAHGEVSIAENALSGNWSQGQHTELSATLKAFVQQLHTGNSNKIRDRGLDFNETRTSMLAMSYLAQAAHNLEGALHWAQDAAQGSSSFGYAWARLAELQFSLGNHQETEKALENALGISPENAQARTLEGFIQLADNHPEAALNSMQKAIELDAGLSNAWLGKGLARFKLGQTTEARQDLQAATILEPQRALLRSYLGKAYEADGEFLAAKRELDRSKVLDPNDPTPWLYGALIQYQKNRLIPAITELQESVKLNDNRSIYRSRSLLDKDQSIRQANLAVMYRDAQMHAWSQREAAQSIEHDYTNASAHLFLANSYDALRDPRQLNLRYETPWASELFLAQLLMPAGSANLSRQISQNEYTALFDQQQFHLINTTEYQSSGLWDQSTSHYGNLSGLSYAVDVNYLNDPGQRPNNDVENLSVWTSAKFNLTPQDELMIQAVYSDYESGDAAQYHSQANGSTTQRVEEDQEPLLFLGYHRVWHPDSHTLFLASYFDDTFERRDPGTIVPVIDRDASGTITGVNPFTFDLNYKRKLRGFSAELQQIFKSDRSTIIGGARYQWAEVDTAARLDRLGTAFPPVFSSPPANQNVSPNLDRFSVYGYHYYQLTEKLTSYLGASVDTQRVPQNTETPPVSADEDTETQISPKIGLRYRPFDQTTFRAAYSRSLGGVFFDQSIRLEPTQMAGFVNAYRSILPESGVGILPGAEQDIGGVAWDQQFGPKTFLTLSGQWLRSDGVRSLGTFDFSNLPADLANTPQSLDYEEKSLLVSLNRLIDPWFFAGANYRLSYATLDTSLSRIPTTVLPTGSVQRDSTLHQLQLFTGIQHPSGFFARVEGIFSRQSHDDSTQTADESVWQWNLWAGYRFWQRRAEVSTGILNIGDHDYQLHPLHYYNELPRERTFAARFRLSF